MLVLIIIFFSAILTLFSGVYGYGKFSRYIGILGLTLALYVSFLPELSFFERYQHMFEFSNQAALFSKITIITSIGIFSLGDFAFSNHRKHQSELYSLMLFSLCGGIILLGFENLVTLFLGIEILSIPLYVMAGSEKTNEKSIEASIKYFLMGAFATGFLLFGTALLYGSTGSFDLKTINSFGIENGLQPMYLMGSILLIISMAFKVSLAPFHMWSPDVYEGSPTLITAFMATIVKITAFYAFFKIITTGFSGILEESKNILYSLIIITILLANVLALIQKNVKRMLAYSSVSHAGYLALIFFSTNFTSYYTLAFYLLAYSISTLGVFISVIYIEKTKQSLFLEDFKGLAKTQPLLATATAVSVFSMAGIPLTAGFIGKFLLFNQVFLEQKLLTIIAIVGSIISIGYYLKLIMAMYFYPQEEAKPETKVSFIYRFLSFIIILLILSLGVFPRLFDCIFGI